MTDFTTRITLERGDIRLARSGERCVTWRPIAGPLSASRRPLFGKETHGDVTTTAVEQVEFVARWSRSAATASPRNRLVEHLEGTDQVRVYDLKACYEVGRRRFLRFVGTRRADDVPH